ncbi:MAG: endonuclease/exonuclease/phosphatase family protein [Candidatus Microgenomates bacterium]
MKIISWNINKASYQRKNLWNFLKEENFDIGLFQEVYMIPYSIRKYYLIVRGEMKAILIKKQITEKIIVNNFNLKKDDVFDIFDLCEIDFFKKKLVIINIYNYIGINEKVFSIFVDFIINFIKVNENRIFILAGDFNMDEKFKDNLLKWGLLMKDFKNKLYDLNFKEVLNESLNQFERYSFFHQGNKKYYQLDYMFVSKQLKIKRFFNKKEEVYNKNSILSDHLPIIIEI